MQFRKTPLPGSYLIELEPVGDQRGHFVRTFCAREFTECGLDPSLAQASLSFNRDKGTLRGLHFQSEPLAENKLVRCAQGAIFDVIVDIRRGSETYGRWFGVELSAGNNRQLYVPKGFAHGFQTLAENTAVAYHISEFYDPDKSAGIRWNDPEIGVAWPLDPVNLSPRDEALPLLQEYDGRRRH